MQRRNKFTRTTAQKGTSKNSAKNKLKVSEKCPRQFSNVKARVLWRDWLICDITRAACEYKRNTKGKRKKKIVTSNLKTKESFYIFPPRSVFPLKGVLLFLKKLMDFSSSNFSCDSLCQVFASGLAGTCSVPPTSNGNNFCKGFLQKVYFATAPCTFHSSSSNETIVSRMHLRNPFTFPSTTIWLSFFHFGDNITWSNWLCDASTFVSKPVVLP